MSCGYCDGQTSELRRRIIQGGGLQFVHQCLTCGRAVSTARPKASIASPDLIPAWDDMLNARFERENHQKSAAEQNAARAAWFKEHNEYLRTAAWRRRRAAVLKRASGWCEGCGQVGATQVHHLSYEHWKEEFLWELVAICEDCHERIHPHMADSAASVGEF